MAPGDPQKAHFEHFRALGPKWPQEAIKRLILSISGLGRQMAPRQMATGGPQKAYFFNFRAWGANWPEGSGFKMKPHLLAACRGLHRNLDVCLGSGFKMKPYLLAAFLGLRRNIDSCLSFFENPRGLPFAVYLHVFVSWMATPRK